MAREEVPALGPLEAYGLSYVECTVLCSEKITSLLALGPQGESSGKSALSCLVVPFIQPGGWMLAALRRGPWKGSLQWGQDSLERVGC